MYYEPKKKRRPGLWLLMIVLLAGAVTLTYIYGPDLYYRFAGDSVSRVKERSLELEERILSRSTAPEDLLVQLEDMQRVLDILERNYPDDPEVHYLQGRFAFYEIAIRVPFTDVTLMKLTGRGYLPQQIVTDTVEAVSIERLSGDMSRRMRKALAIDPDLDQGPEANLYVLYGDILYTGRTDPHLINRLDTISDAEWTRFDQKHYDWMALALNALAGRADRLAATIQAMDSAGADEADASLRLSLNQNIRNLVLSHGHYRGRNYLQALQLARAVRYSPDAPTGFRVEAILVEAEVFSIQRGPAAGIYFFKEALAVAGGSETYIESKLESLGGTTDG